jgi:hypothetical protein
MANTLIRMAFIYFLVFVQSVYSQTDNDKTVAIMTNPLYPINMMSLDGDYSPIGWSMDGKIAYVFCRRTQRDYEKYFVSQVGLMDIVTNEMEIMIGSTQFDDGQESNVSNIFLNLWQHSEKKITETLQEYDIVSFPNIELQGYEDLKKRYNLEIEFEYLENENDDLTENRIKVFIKNEKDEKENIFDILDSSNAAGKLVGYYESPFIKRLVLYIKAEINDLNTKYKTKHILFGYPYR